MKKLLNAQFLLVIIFLVFAFVSLKAQTISTTNLRVNYLTNPQGIDDMPRFSWQTVAKQRGVSQLAYRVLVASSPELIASNVGDMWDSGKVLSPLSYNVSYVGMPLKSKTHYYWKVCVWNSVDQLGTWSEMGDFGMAMLAPEDWSAQWITPQGEGESAIPHVLIKFDEPVLSRFVRLNVTKIGIPVDENNQWRMQLAELEVYSPLDTIKNIALNKTVSFTGQHIIGEWKPKNLTDGILTSISSSPGATSIAYSSETPTNPLYIQIDLGSEYLIDRVVLYPRSDVPSKINNSLVGSFPLDYTIQTKVTDGANYTVRKIVKNQSTPKLLKIVQSLPLMGKNIEINKPIKRAVMYASGLGLFDFKVNGKKVTDNVLEPGESNYRKTILYSTYNITDLLRQGKNTFISTIGNAMYHNPQNNRYQKLSNMFGMIKLLAQIEIEYLDGSKQTVVTDNTWKSTSGPITFSAWYGGEDYDARLEIENIETPGYDVSQWNGVKVCYEKEGTLKAQFYQPTRVVEEWKAVAVTNPTKGVYVVDFGRNYAGTFEFDLKGNKGTAIECWPAEVLTTAGRADQRLVGSPVYDVYTFSGNKNGEKWGPKFIYHGMQFLEIRGLETALTPDMFTAKVIRAGGEKVGEFVTSNNLLNQIDVLLNRSIESNLYNTMTDCPHREKLGWLEVPNLLYNSLVPTYDLAAWMNKISMDIKDTQQSNGMVTTTAPEFAWFGGQFRDDPTWSAATITVPWQSYKTYGDMNQLINAYPTMIKLMDYFESRSNNYLLNYGLGDWGAIDNTTSVGFTVSCTYLHLATTMTQIAEALGNDADITKYTTLAANIRQAINTTYFKTATSSYDSGSQASNAMALYYGVVPENKKSAVLAKLVASVNAKNNHLSTGEISLKPLLFSLADNGYNELVYTMANKTTQPSYGYFVVNGCTSTPEFWDIVSASRNHCMMGHIKSWFYEKLGGIQNAGIAYDHFTVAPFIPNTMDSAQVVTTSMYGVIRSSWKRGDSTITLRVNVPANSSSTVILPTNNLKSVTENGVPLIKGNGIKSFDLVNNMVSIEIGSGDYKFDFSSNDK